MTTENKTIFTKIITQILDDGRTEFSFAVENKNGSFYIYLNQRTVECRVDLLRPCLLKMTFMTYQNSSRDPWRL